LFELTLSDSGKYPRGGFPPHVVHELPLFVEYDKDALSGAHTIMFPFADIAIALSPPAVAPEGYDEKLVHDVPPFVEYAP
jgi:hypothetical protein